MIKDLIHKTSSFLAISALSLGLGGVAQAQEAEMDSAVQMVRLFFADHSTRFIAGDEPLLNQAKAAEKYMVDDLAIDGLQGQLGADPVFCGQDAEIADLQIMPDPELPMLRGAAQVRVNFTNFGRPTSTLYTLVQWKPGEEWQISDIYCETDNWSLVQAMREMGISYAPNDGTETTLNLADAEMDDPDEQVGMEQGDLPGNGQPGEGSDLLFILDGSGSMWGQIDGVAKITTAKKALKGLVGDLPSTTRVGLMAYGHRREGDCADTEILMPVADHASGQMGPAIDGVSPRGKTPIAGALAEAAGAFPSADRRANILLISDGLETCGGDPCAAAAELAAQGVDTRVHVVGFDLSEEEAQALQCIADNGNGNYYAAANADEFVDAVEQAFADTEAPAEPEPAPAPEPEPVASKYFEENFDGPALDAAWSIEQELADAKALNGAGEMFVSAFGRNNFYDHAEAQNRYILDKPLPDGDFDLTMQVRFPIQTGSEHAWLSLYDNAANQIGALLWAEWKGCGRSINLSLIKVAGAEGEKPEKTQFKSVMFDGPVIDNICSAGPRADADKILQMLADEGAKLTLKRRGRKLTASVTLNVPAMGDNPAQSVTLESEEITSLRLSGQPSFFLGQWNGGAPGESHYFVDQFAIEQLQ
jgi:Mg-chelatase subunit ChlD